MVILEESKKDYFQIDEMVKESFAKGTSFGDGSSEIKLIHEIRNGKNYIPNLSIIAKEDNLIVGHIMLSLFPTSNKDIKVLLLAPLAARYGMFKKGIGSALILETIKRAKASGFDYIILTGHVDYYHRFGFVGSYNHLFFPGKCCDVPDKEILMSYCLHNKINNEHVNLDFDIFECLR